MALSNWNVGLEAAWQFQRGMSHAQKMPIIGPLVISPIKAVASVAELVAGVAIGIFFGALFLISMNDTCGEFTIKGAAHAGIGLLSFGYSILNIITLGLAARRIESESRML